MTEIRNEVEYAKPRGKILDIKPKHKGFLH